MDKKEFIFPGVILGLVLIIAVGLLLTQGRETTPPLQQTVATTATATSTATATATPGTAGTVANPPTSYYPYGTVVLGVNQAAGFKSGLSIRSVAVLEDSRCPTDVVCIQAGTVRLSLKTTINGTSATQTIALGETKTISGTKITFKSAAPSRMADERVADSAYRFTFVVESGTVAAGQCYVGGCSSEICSDTKDQVSACLYNSSYACYRTATCERQASGSCGWTQTESLKKCLANPPENN